MTLLSSLLLILVVVVIILLAGNIGFMIARMQRLEQLISNMQKPKKQPHDQAIKNLEEDKLPSNPKEVKEQFYEQKATQDATPPSPQYNHSKMQVMKNLTKDKSPNNLEKVKKQAHEQKITQNKPGKMQVIKNLNEDELPDNLQKVKVSGAEQIVDGTPIKINPQKVTVKENEEKIQINIRTKTQKNRTNK